MRVRLPGSLACAGRSFASLRMTYLPSIPSIAAEIGLTPSYFLHCSPSHRRLRLSHAPPGHAVLLTELLTPDRVVVPLPAGDRHTAIAALTRRLTEHAGARYDEVLGAVMERESVLGTGTGFGV